MKKTLFIIASIASIFVVSCTKEQVTEIASEDVTAPVGVVYKDGKTYLTINAPEESKVNIVNRVDDITEDSKRTIFWEEGDKLAWNGDASDALGKSYTPEAHSKSATFTWDGTLERPAMLFTPADFYKNYEEDPTIVTLPEKGEMTGDDNIVKNNYPMCGTISESGEVTLNPLCAIVRLQIKGTVNEGSISKVEFSGRKEEQIWGDFKVDYTNATLTSQSTAAEFRKVTVNCEKDFSTTEAKYVNVIVPAGTYSNGFQVKIYDNSGKAMVQEKKSKTTLTAGKIVSFPVLTFNGVLDIKNADDWNDFASKYNSSDPDLLANLTTVNIVDNLDFTGKTITTITRNFTHTLEGNDYSFQNVKLTNEGIVTRLTGGGIIKNVKIDGQSKLVVNDDRESYNYFAPLLLTCDENCVVEKCESAATVEFEVSSTTASRFIGGLVGRIRSGSVKGCKVSGNLVDTETGTPTKISYIGGIVGDVNHRVETDTGRSLGPGLISGCEFSGKILVGPKAGTTEDDYTGPSSKETNIDLRVGGIAARSQNSEVKNCSTTSDAEIDVRGNMYVLYVGGIIANPQTSVTGCNNYATISIWSDGTNNSGGQAFVGGVSGDSNQIISNCKNYGDINIYSTHRTSHYGGILGRSDGASLQTCTNYGKITQGKKAPRYLYIGGVLGGFKDTTGNISDVHNEADITVNYIPGTTTPFGKTYCGGVIGYNQLAISGQNNIDNSGKVKVNITRQDYIDVAAGGIIGYNTANVSGVKNKAEGSVTITCSSTVEQGTITAVGGICGYNTASISGTETVKCINSAPVQLTGSGKLIESMVGGICGYSTGDISYTENSGAITTNCNSKTIHIGGIVAKAECAVSNCINAATGTITRSSQTTTGEDNKNIFMGGIVGSLQGDTPKVISAVTNNAKVVSYVPGISTATTTLLGGIVGLNTCAGAEINGNSTNSGVVHVSVEYATSETPTYAFPLSAVGGIIGGANAKIKISSCFSAGNLNCQYSGGKRCDSRPAYTGGIAGLLDNFSFGTVTTGAGIEATISDCSVSGAVQATNFNNSVDNLTKGNYVGGIVGAAVGNAANAVTISGCSTSSTADTDAGGHFYGYRGFNGGVAGYIKNAKVTGGEGKSFAKTMNANQNCQHLAGLAGEMVSSTFEGCTFSGTGILRAVSVSGFVSNIDGNSEIKNCTLKNVNLEAKTKTVVFANTAASGAKFTENTVDNSKIDGTKITTYDESNFFSTNKGANVVDTTVK